MKIFGNAKKIPGIVIVLVGNAIVLVGIVIVLPEEYEFL